MSSVLQESGFEPEDIRIVLNDRATTQGIMDRLHWLLDGVRDGDERMLFYSGTLEDHRHARHPGPL